MSNNILNDISKVYLEQVVNSETELEEGMTMRDFKKQRSRQKQKEKRAAEKTSPTRRSNMSSYERAVRHRANVDPDYDRGGEERDYPGGVTKNPKKVRKAKALGEIGESSHLETDMKKRREANEKAVEDMKKTAAYKSMAATAAKKFDEETEPDPFGRPGGKYGGVKKGGGYDKGYRAMQKKLKELDKVKKEGLDPVGKEDADIDNDGKPNTKKDKYLMHRRNVIKQQIATQKEAKEVNDGNLANNYPPYDKVTRGDIIAGALGQDQMGGKKKKKVTKEGYSNWRQDLAEVITKDQNQTPIKEKKVENKIIINPPMKIGEAISNLGGELIEMVEIDEAETGRGPRLIDAYDKPPYSDEVKDAPKYKPVRKGSKMKGVVKKEEIELDEKTLTSAETKKKEEIVKSMKKNLAAFRARYGDRAKEVMYATATKQAKKVAEQASEIAPKEQSTATKPNPAEVARQKQLVQIQKKQTMDRLAQLNKGVPVTSESSDDAMSIVMKDIIKKHGAKAIVGSAANKRVQASEPKSEKPKRKLRGYSIPGAPPEKSYHD
jgi:hypothetical protein